MTFQEFSSLWSGANESESFEKWVAELGCPAFLPEKDPLSALKAVWEAREDTVWALATMGDATNNEVSRMYGIPLATVECWLRHEREIPPYVARMLAYCFLSDLGVLGNGGEN